MGELGPVLRQEGLLLEWIKLRSGLLQLLELLGRGSSLWERSNRRPSVLSWLPAAGPVPALLGATRTALVREERTAARTAGMWRPQGQVEH